MPTIEVNGTLELRRLFIQAAEDQVACVFWWTGQTRIFRAKLKFESENPKVEFAIDPNDMENAKEWLDSSQVKRPLVSMMLYLPHLGILGFQTELLRSQKTEWAFGIPEKAVLSQRRASGRYPIPKAYEYSTQMKVKGIAGSYTGILRDLSEIGLSVDVEDSKLLHRGQEITEVSMRIQGQSFKFSGIVRSLRNDRVGIEILKISDENSENIQSFLLRNFVQHLPKRFDFLQNIKIISR